MQFNEWVKSWICEKYHYLLRVSKVQTDQLIGTDVYCSAVYGSVKKGKGVDPTTSGLKAEWFCDKT